MSIPILNQIEQSEAKLRKLQASLDEEQASVFAAEKKYQGNLKRGKATDSEGAYLAKRMGALKERYQNVIAAQEAHLDLQKQAIHHQLEKQHGLLSYAIASGEVSAEMQLLHGSLADYLNAKNDIDRARAKKDVDLCWEHSTLPKLGEKSSAPDTAILDQYERLEDEDATAFYKENQTAILAQMDARRASQNNIN